MDQYKKIEALSTDQNYIREIITRIFGTLTDDQFDNLYPLFDWIQVAAGKQLIYQGEESNHIYFLVYGRLTAIYENSAGNSRILGEIVPGQAVGEAGVIADQPRTAHVFAARDSILIRLSRKMLYKLGNQYPVLIMNVAKTIIRRADQNSKGKTVTRRKNVVFLSSNHSPMKTQFLDQLSSQLGIFGKITYLDLETISRITGINSDDISAVEAMHEINIRLQKKLDEIENSSDFVIFHAVEDQSQWIEKVIAQADVFYILKEFNESEELTPSEEKLFSDHLEYRLTKKNLVLLHPHGDQYPQNTARFLKNRSLELHHHIRMDRSTDIERLARFISGNAIGIALSGGGARGLAHVGIILGLRNKGIPVDFFSGTSVGTFIAAFGALDLASQQMYDWGHILAKGAPTRRKNMNIAPLISLMKGKHLDDLLEKNFGKYNIEDAWINSIYVASDLTNRAKVIISSGPMSYAIRASIALPGIFPPAVSNNSLFVDGGIFENLPVESLEDYPVNKKIAVTLHSTKKYNLEYDVVPEPWQYLRDRILGKRKLKVPTISTILMESMVLSSYSRYEESIRKVDLHLHPPVHKIGIMEWDAYEEMVEIGQNYTNDIIDTEIHNQLLPYPDSTIGEEKTSENQ